MSDELVERWNTDRGRKVKSMVLEAIKGRGRWDEVYDFTGSSPRSAKADLRGISFRSQDLRKADLSNLNLSKANFSDAQLAGADLQLSDLDDAVFDNANLTEANLVGCSAQRAIFSRATLARTCAMHSNFTSARFDSADLTDATLRGSLGRWADLRNAILRSTDLEKSDWRGANIRGIVWDHVNVLHALIPQPGIRSKAPDATPWVVLMLGTAVISFESVQLSGVELLQRLKRSIVRKQETADRNPAAKAPRG